MSQRPSGYQRNYRDLYETPSWVTEALLPHLPSDMIIWEPACGSGKMVDVLRAGGHQVVGTDLSISGQDFLLIPAAHACEAIVTNPPYELAQKFIERALILAPIVAMLLRTDFDHAATRRHLFGDCRRFAMKIVLTKRIKWFEGSAGSPSFNHAWFVWAKSINRAPVVRYHYASVALRSKSTPATDVVHERMGHV